MEWSRLEQISLGREGGKGRFFAVTGEGRKDLACFQRDGGLDGWERFLVVGQVGV